MATDETECCPPQSSSDPLKPNVPHPVAASDYKPLGKLEKMGGFDEVYVTGPEDAKQAVIVVYDIFGLHNITLRGVDILAWHLASTVPTRLYVPDFFRGHPFPKDKDGNKEELAKFFQGTAKIADRQPELIKFAEHIKKETGVKHVGALGYCWGGKMVLLSSHSDSPINRTATVHPAMIAKVDGDPLGIPLGFYPSKDEPKDVIDYIQSKNVNGDYKHYETVHHGWAAARANLGDEENFLQFNDVYDRLGRFFSSSQ